jgi:hypothetical protein
VGTVEVHAGGDKLELKTRVRLDRPQRGPHQPELGAGAGDEAYPSTMG